MKIRLSTVIWIFVSLALVFTLVTERSQQARLVAEWQTERSKLVDAAILFSKHEQILQNGTWKDFESERQHAAECLILLSNIERELQQVVNIRFKDQDDASAAFSFVIHSFWTMAGKPSYDELEEISKRTKTNISIDDAQGLRALISKF